MGIKYELTAEDKKGKTYFKNNEFKIDDYITNNHIKFKDINFTSSNNIIDLINQLSISIKSIEFDNCILDSFKINNDSYINSIKIENSLVVGRIEILSHKNIEELSLNNTKCYSKVKIQECKISGKTSFNNTSFKDLADFYRTIFHLVDFQKADFEVISVFAEAEFYENINFQYVKFLGKVIFRDTVFEKELNLRDTIFDDDANFLDITSYKKNNISESTSLIKVSNRETARIIKTFFDKSNNIIEANKFYALEMRERTNELKKYEKNQLPEYTLFLLHKITSNHSQNAFLVLIWLLNISLLWSLVEVEGYPQISVNFVFELIVYIGITYVILRVVLGLISMLQNIMLSILTMMVVIFISTKGITIQSWLEHLNPFHKLSTTISGHDLFFKIIMAYLTYQFIVSIRQNTRRK